MGNIEMCPYIIGQRIFDLRQVHKMTQKELADKLCLSAKSVSKWETGRSLPGIAHLPKIAVIFAITVDELIAHPEIQ